MDSESEVGDGGREICAKQNVLALQVPMRDRPFRGPARPVQMRHAGRDPARHPQQLLYGERATNWGPTCPLLPWGRCVRAREFWARVRAASQIVVQTAERVILVDEEAAAAVELCGRPFAGNIRIMRFAGIAIAADAQQLDDIRVLQMRHFEQVPLGAPRERILEFLHSDWHPIRIRIRIAFFSLRDARILLRGKNWIEEHFVYNTEPTATENLRGQLLVPELGRAYFAYALRGISNLALFVNGMNWVCPGVPVG